MGPNVHSGKPPQYQSSLHSQQQQANKLPQHISRLPSRHQSVFPKHHLRNIRNPQKHLREMASKKINYESEEIEFIGANDLRKGSFVLLRGKEPCKVVEYDKSKTGKHGSCKIHVIGLHIFTGRKYEEIFKSTQQVTVPVVQKVEWTLLDIVDGYLKLQGSDGSIRDDIRMPESDSELGSRIEEFFYDDKTVLVTLQSALNKEEVVACRSREPKP